MNKTSLLRPVFVIAGAALFATGCVVREQVRYQNPPVALGDVTSASGVVYVNSGPPAPAVDVVTVAPGPGFVWVGGAWYWQGRWVWHPGYWGRPPRPGAIWIAPHYGYRSHRHVWYRGYWR